MMKTLEKLFRRGLRRLRHASGGGRRLCFEGMILRGMDGDRAWGCALFKLAEP